MEVVAATPGAGTPFHDHDVREWSRIDSLTGVLERARLETDQWTANTSNSCHKYGKVVDSRARTNADGALQQQARRQLEVFQSQIPGGHLQVIKTQTVSSSRWSNKSSDSQEIPIKDFENLQLSLNPLDFSSQKSKANVGRSVGRRPPSRPRARDESLRTAQQNLYHVSRLCHQIHENKVKQTIQGNNEFNDNERLNGHLSLTRAKSTSSEDLHLDDASSKSIEDLEDLEQLQSWRRTSKLRRSLQYLKESKPQAAKPLDLPENSGSVRKIREELEKGRRLSTALRGNSVDLQALDQILQTISNSSCSSNSSNHSDKLDEYQDELETKKQKRNSFVTVETLQEVRGRLRRTSTPTDEVYKVSKDEEADDGIVTEEKNEMPVSEKSRVRSYVYGMETMLNKKPIVGTGSLESRTKLLNGGTSLRSEDWYNRRKSYGFEQVHNHTEAPSAISLKSKGRSESSTDSGICRSSEIVIVPTTKTDSCDEKTFTSVKQISSIFDKGFNKDLKSTTITIPIGSKPNSNFVDIGWNDVPERDIKRHSIAVDESKYVTNNSENKFRRTSLAINPSTEDTNALNRKSKKVEFCKTEVHFAAESGKVNIVETDEKPPPTNNFRRRRRNSGPVITDDVERTNLPVLHFGDTSYEKILLGVADEDNFDTPTTSNDEYQNSQSNVSCSTVTVNTSSTNPVDLQEDEKRDSSENVKGILKNKPVKPTPYHLGEDPFLNSNSDSDNGKWGVRLKPVPKTETPYWKSTVTLHNTVYGQENVTKDEQPEFQKLLKNLRPTNGNQPDLLANQRNSDNFSSVKFVTSTDNRRPWSVADRVKLSEDSQWAENKVYSTKVNFGDGGTAVVENDQFELKSQSPWGKGESFVKDPERILNKGLVVRIGRNDSTSKHTVCSKTTSMDSNTTTTTKITIDLSPSPTNTNIKNSSLVPQNQRSHCFKSTSLILDTIKNDCLKTNHTNIPQQLEALKKLYEDVQSDSDADKEVQVLMGKMDRREFENDKDDNTSEISGSWSKMKACRIFNEHINKTNVTRQIPSDRISAKVEKDDTKENARKKFGIENSLSSSTYFESNQSEQASKMYKVKLKNSKYSPVVFRRNNTPLAKRTDLKSVTASEKLSSPSLVGRSTKLDLRSNKYQYTEEKDFANITDHKLHEKHSTSDIVLRQPKKSEMTYFGVKVSPEVRKKQETVITKEFKLSEKPDLLQHMKSDSPKSKNRWRKNSFENDQPIYENVTKNKPRPEKEFDSNILEELTKAADQILLAVNGFTDDDSHTKCSGEENTFSTKPLDTITESKSWSHSKNVKTTTKQSSVKSKLKHTSSTSSVESLSRNKKPQLKSTPVKKKSPTTETSLTRANTKARRLQRASSREALLQSHGSSSEDLGANTQVPVRKPRQIRKIKSTQLTVSNGIDLNKKITPPNPPRRKRDSSKSRVDERVEPVPEIRHKTAVSTITSTADKTSRDRSRSRTENPKKKLPQKKESSKGTTTKSESKKPVSSKEISSHRISTANIKKCRRADETTRH